MYRQPGRNLSKRKSKNLHFTRDSARNFPPRSSLFLRGQYAWKFLLDGASKLVTYHRGAPKDGVVLTPPRRTLNKLQCAQITYDVAKSAWASGEGRGGGVKHKDWGALAAAAPLPRQSKTEIIEERGTRREMWRKNSKISRSVIFSPLLYRSSFSKNNYKK